MRIELQVEKLCLNIMFEHCYTSKEVYGEHVFSYRGLRANCGFMVTQNGPWQFIQTIYMIKLFLHINNNINKTIYFTNYLFITGTACKLN